MPMVKKLCEASTVKGSLTTQNGGTWLHTYTRIIISIIFTFAHQLAAYIIYRLIPNHGKKI